MARKFLNGVDVTGTAVVTAVLSTSGIQTVLRVTGSADTGQTGATEKIDIDFALNRTVQWATGALATQRAFVVRAPTYAFVGASTVTNAATLAITGAPVAGANATLTNTRALWVQSGMTRFDGQVQILGGTPTLGLTTAMLTLSRDTDGYVFTVEAPNMTGTPAFGIQNVPLSTDLNTGKGFELKVAGEGFGRVMFYTDGKFGIGPGSSTRDVILSRPTTSTFRVSSDGVNGVGGGGFEVNGRGSFGANLVTAVQFNVTQVVATTGSPSVVRFTGGAHTTLTLSAEAVDFDFAANRTVQFATGALATQRSTLFRAPTYGFVGASVVTNAATVAITGAPVAGANATITNGMALWVQAGMARFDDMVDIANGSAALPALSFFSDNDTGIFAVGANAFGITAGGTLRFTVSDTAITSTLINVLPATTTGSASLRMPHGTAPSAPTDGDMWSTTAGFFGHASGVTYGPFSNGTVTSVGLSVPAFLSVSGSPVTSSGTLAVTFSGTAIPMANGGTGSTAFTAGSVAFSNGTILTQDNANLFWDDTNNRLGIGTNTPGYPLTVVGKLTSSTGYILGFDLSLIPIAGGQSAVSTWWGMQLVGNQQSNVDYTPGNIYGAGDFSVIIPNQQAGAIGLIIRGQTSQTGNLFELRNIGGTGLSAFNAAGKLALGLTAPTALLHLAAGTATASTAPIKFTAGTNLTTAEAGALEWDGTNLYVTQTTGPTRKTIAYTDNASGIVISANQVAYGSGVNTVTGNASFTFAPATGLLVSNAVTITPAASTGAPGRELTINTAAHTALTASTEFTTVAILGATQQFATGALTTQRFTRIEAPTYAFVAASTITNAATFAITGAPIAGTNATLTNAYALWVQSGNVRFDSVNTTMNAGTTVAPTGCFLTGSIADFFQYDIKNTSAGIGAQSGYSATADNGSPTTGFAWMGINNSGTPLVAAYNIGAANDVSFLGSGQNMYVANSNNTKDIIFSLGKAASPYFDEFMRIKRSTNGVTITPPVATSGSPLAFSVTGAAHTTLAASTEAIDTRFNFARTVQFATGALALQRAMVIDAPTLAFVGASTVTAAVTLDISGAPVAGTNATLTNSWALRVAAGPSLFAGRAFFSTGTAALPGITFNEAATGSDTGFYSIGDGQIGVTTNGTLRLTINTTAFTGTLPWRGQDGTAALPAYAFSGDTDTGMWRIGGNAIGFSVQGVLSAALRTTSTQTSANFDLTPVLVASGAACAFRLITPADTAQTLSTEASSFILNFSATRQWATGALTTQRAARITAPTYGFVGASTITNAATLAIAGAPIAGANATITNSMALWVEAGMSRFDGVVAVGAGSAAAPGLFAFGDSDTGIYSVGANALGITAGGTLRLTVSDTAITSALINVFVASTTSAASLRVPHGTAPTSPVDGDEWSTTAGRFARINGVTTNLSRLVFALTDGANIAVNSAAGDVFTVTIAGNRTMDAPTNPVNGRLMTFRIKQDATGSRTITWNAAYAFTASLPAPTLSTTPNLIDYVGFIYDSTSAKWHCVSYVIGHS